MDNPYPFHYDMPSQRISDSEIVVQKQCRDMVAKLFPNTRVAAVPNGTHIATMRGRMKVKREGLSAGFPDLILVGRMARLYPAPLVAFAEIKAKAAMSDEQKAWLMFMIDCGHNCGIFRSDVTLEAKMREWGFS